jgi:hypothetical protein
LGQLDDLKTLVSCKKKGKFYFLPKKPGGVAQKKATSQILVMFQGIYRKLLFLSSIKIG